jgi:hypothetical protein
VDGYARALKRGRFRTLAEAVREYLRDIDALRKRYPDARWLRFRRSPAAVATRLAARAHRLGIRFSSLWTPEENRLAGRYALRVVQGEIPNPSQAAHRLAAELERLRARYPRLPWLQTRRTWRSYFDQIWRKARELGRPYVVLPWSPPERLVLQSYARRLVQGKLPSARQAAVGALREIERLHRRNPRARWAKVHRTVKTTGQMITREAHTLRQVWLLAHWTPAEEKLLDRYARAFAEGRFRRVDDAGRRCWVELERRHRRRLQRNPRLTPTPQPRSLDSTCRMLRRHVFRLIGRRRGKPWTTPEAKLALKWAARYPAYRNVRDGAALRRVLSGLQEDLRKHGFIRDAAMCRNRLFLTLEGHVGLPRPRPGRPRSTRPPSRRMKAQG